MSLLDVRELRVAIHGEKILKDINFKIDRGRVFGVVGESGSGKSMTALSIVNLLPAGSARSGFCALGGRDLFELSERQMCDVRGKDIGMIFQEPMTALNPVQTIGRQIAETLVIHGACSAAEAMSLAREKLDRVEMPASRFPLNLYPHELSGGQRQRVCIALAIALRPQLLIADEPTTALDVSTQARILRLLQSLVEEENMSLMLITHDLAVIAETAEHVAVMQNGKIVESGQTESLFRNMKHPYTKSLLSASSHAPVRASPQRDEKLLEVRKAIRDYPLRRTSLFERPKRLRAVDEVSFELSKGESLGLVGESGCGKSTLTRAILGLESLQGGRISFEGTDVVAGGRMPRSLRRKMQVVFQDPYSSFNPRHKVDRLIAEPLHLCEERPSRAQRRKRVAEVLIDVGLSRSDMDKYIHEFSGGQRQRIAIARALVLRPRLMVLDEAVSALDVSIRAQILDLLAEIQRKHALSYLFISHDLTVVRAVTDRVMVMKGGRIVEEGVTEHIFRTPQNDYTRKLLDAAPFIPQAWRTGLGTQAIQ